MLIKSLSVAALMLAVPVLGAASMSDRGTPVDPTPRTALAVATTPIDDFDQGWMAFTDEHPGVARTMRMGRLERIYGAAFSTGDHAADSAGRFVQENAERLFGIQPEQFLPIGPWLSQEHVLPLVTDPVTGDAKFMLVGYVPHVDGTPVFDAAIRVLVRNEPGFPTVLVSAQVPELGDFALPGGLLPGGLDADRFAAEARMRFRDSEISGIRPVVYAGSDGTSLPPRAGVDFTITGSGVDGAYSKWRFVADPATGEIIHEQNEILHADVNVQVMANRTTEFSMECGPEIMGPLPHARVTVGGTVYVADENGIATIPNGGSGSVTANVEARTRWFNVDNGAGDTSVTVPSGGNGIAVINADNSSDTQRAYANTIYFAEEVRNFTLQYNSSYPVISNQENFTINTGVSGTCNAYYDGGSINFYNAGGGCANTAIDVVIHHEYGHHLVNTAGSGQQSYGEGAGDTCGVLITGDPRLAVGFFMNQCDEGIRNADNNCSYSPTGCSSCGSAIHTCGQVLSGMAWEIREKLIAAGKPTSIIESHFFNSIPMHNGSAINEAIVIDWLTLDDDNGNILDGTPNYAEISGGAGVKGLPGPELQLLVFEFPDGRPNTIDPATGATFTVDVLPLGDNPTPSNARIYFRESGSVWQNQIMQNQGGNSYLASLPAAECGTTVDWYVSANSGSTPVSSPTNAPSDTYSSLSVIDIVVGYQDDFEKSISGWVVTNDPGLTSGAWERGNPDGTSTRGEPDAAYEGEFCLLTENGNGNFDIDGGCTTIATPVIDATDPGSIIKYARWYDNTGAGTGADPNNDLFTIEITDDGVNWTELEVVGPVAQSSGGWYLVSLRVSDFVENTDTVQVRFQACDLNDGSVVEAAIDLFVVEAIQCDSDGLIGDFNGDCIVDGEDFGFLLTQWGEVDSPANLDGEGGVDGSDVGLFFTNFGNTCP